MAKIQDIYGNDYIIQDLKSFISHIKKYHTIHLMENQTIVFMKKMDIILK